MTINNDQDYNSLFDTLKQSGIDISDEYKKKL